MATEKRLIDANEIVSKLKNKMINPQTMFINTVLLGLIDEAPTVDAVEVVRCKDCKHYDEIKHGYGWCCKCNDRHEYAKDEEYCSFGERREGG